MLVPPPARIAPKAFMPPSLLHRAYWRARPRPRFPLIGGPADGLLLTVPRPVPPRVYAAVRRTLDGTTLLAVACDESAVYIASSGDGSPIAHYRLVGSRYLHEPLP